MKKQFELLKNYHDFNVNRLQELINDNIYSFKYDEVACVNLDFDCEIDRFQRNVKIMINFIVHSIDLIKFKKLDYFFEMQSLYLIDDDSVDVMKILRKRRKTDKSLISSFKTKTSRALINS